MSSTLRAALALPLALALVGCGGERRVARAPTTTPADVLEHPEAIQYGWKTDFTKFSIPLREFELGGPGKDGIPALTEPKFASVDDTRYLAPQEPVIALELNGEARAYPLQILTWHEIVDDELGGVPVAVTFCPLCNTAIVFDRRVRGKKLVFGTTGNLRNSDLVMYDRQTESWWQQFSGEAVVGDYTATRLRQLPARIVSWAEFARAHPDGGVLSRNTDYDRPYGENPYWGYDDVSTPPFFPVENGNDDRLPPKERVVLIERGGAAVAVPYSTLAKKPLLTLMVSGHRFEVRYRRGVSSALDATTIGAGRDVGSAEVLETGRPVAFSEPFWFAVAAFRPKVEVVR